MSDFWNPYAALTSGRRRLLGAGAVLAVLLLWGLIAASGLVSATKLPGPWDVLAALAYLGLPFDGLPDPTPIVGFSDDLAVLIGALAAVAVCIRIRHIRLARARMRAWGIRVEDVANDREDDDPWTD